MDGDLPRRQCKCLGKLHQELSCTHTSTLCRYIWERTHEGQTLGTCHTLHHQSHTMVVQHSRHTSRNNKPLCLSIALCMDQIVVCSAQVRTETISPKEKDMSDSSSQPKKHMFLLQFAVLEIAPVSLPPAPTSPVPPIASRGLREVSKANFG